MDPKVSIIIPNYNTESYILACLRSIERQNYRNLEIIIVDDGSTDNSVDIINAHIKGRNNIIFIHKKNGGVSSARNVGIEYATGEWIAFIDSDDYVEENYISNMIEGVIHYPTDFCMTGLKRVFDNSSEIYEGFNTKFSYGSIIEKLGCLFLHPPYARMYSTRIIKEHGIRFDERILCGEDRAFNFDYLIHVDKVLVLDENAYYYRMRKGSITNTSVMPDKKRYVYEHIKEFWRRFPQQKRLCEIFKENYHFAHTTVDAYLNEIILSVLDENDDYFKELLDDPLGRYIIENYNYEASRYKEKVLVRLIRGRKLCATKEIIKIYYDKKLHSFLRQLVDKLR